MKLLCISNTRSANGEHMSAIAEKELKSAGHSLRFLGEGGADNSELFQWANAIVVIGGDGTLNYHLPTLLKVKKPILLVPAGTANDFATALGLPLNIRSVCALLEDGEAIHVDVAAANDKPFVNVAHIGFAVDAKKGVNKTAKRFLGPLVYLWSALKTAKSRVVRVDIVVSDGGCEKAQQRGAEPQKIGKHQYKPFEGKLAGLKTEQISVANSGQFGGGWRLTNSSNPFNGRLELVSVAPGTMWQRFVQFVMCWFNRQTEHRQVTHLKGSGFGVSTSKSMEVTGDGEELTSTPVEFTLHHKALVFYVDKKTSQQQ